MSHQKPQQCSFFLFAGGTANIVVSLDFNSGAPPNFCEHFLQIVPQPITLNRNNYLYLKHKANHSPVAKIEPASLY